MLSKKFNSKERVLRVPAPHRSSVQRVKIAAELFKAKLAIFQLAWINYITIKPQRTTVLTDGHETETLKSQQNSV